LDGVVDGICDKLVRRHPHVFGSADASDAGEALANWEQIKKKEKGDRGALDGVPKALPSLLRAIRVGEKASAVGYDWPNAEGAREKIDEELRELDAAATEAPERLEEELGDLLFSIANFARKRKLDPEAALRGALDRFTGRFEYAEQIAKERGASLSDLGAEELDELWERAKDQAAQR
ncbi:MAG: MazG family protein, partial [Myxococcota bacterium]